MALTISKLSSVTNQPQHIGQLKAVLATVTFDNDYPDGGEAITAAAFGLNKLVAICPFGMAKKSDNELAVGVTYDATNGTLVCFESAGDGDPFDEVTTNATNIDGFVVTVMALGY